MREIRLSGSEGGGIESNRSFLPLHGRSRKTAQDWRRNSCRLPEVEHAISHHLIRAVRTLEIYRNAVTFQSPGSAATRRTLGTATPHAIPQRGFTTHAGNANGFHNTRTEYAERCFTMRTIVEPRWGTVQRQRESQGTRLHREPWAVESNPFGVKRKNGLSPVACTGIDAVRFLRCSAR